VRNQCARDLVDVARGAARGLVWDVAAPLKGISCYRDVLKLNGGDFESQLFQLLP
jgi:hypothetical protein